MSDKEALLKASHRGNEAEVQVLIAKIANTYNGVKRRRAYSFALVAAASSGSIDIVNILLKNGADVNFRSVSNGRCRAICEACRWGHIAVVKTLIDNGADFTSVCYHNHGFPFEAAAQANRTDIVELLISHGIATNSGSFHYDSALYVAARSGSLQMTKLLIQNGADVNAQNREGDNILVAAVRSGNEEIVRILIQHGAKLLPIMVQANHDENSFVIELPRAYHALAIAAEGEFEEIVRLLISADGDVETRQSICSMALYLAAEIGNTKIAEMVLQNITGLGLKINRHAGEDPWGTNRSCLQIAAEYGHRHILQLLLTAGADPNRSDDWGNTALLYATRQGNDDIIKDLIAAGALIEHRSKSGDNALSVAVNRGTSEVTKILVENGASITARGKVQSALYLAASWNKHEKLRILLSTKDEINAPGCDTGDALCISASKGYEGVVDILLKHGVDVNSSNAKQESPLHLSTRNGHLGIVRILLAYGVNVDAIAEGQGTALGIAAEKSHLDIFEILVRHKIMALNHKDNTSSDLAFMAPDIGH